MKKTLHNIVLVALFTLMVSLPSEVKADDFQRTQIEMEQNSISVSVSDATLYVKNAEHMVLEIYSITGQKIFTGRIDSQSKAFELDNLNRGCYIVRIGKYTRKVYIK